MELDQVVQQLPVVIGDAVWRHLQKSTETSETEVQLKGDLEVSLPGLSITFSLFHTFTGESNYHDIEDDKIEGTDADSTKNKDEGGGDAPNLNEGSEENESPMETLESVNDTTEKVTSEVDNEVVKITKEIAQKKQAKRQASKKRSSSPIDETDHSESEGSDVNLSDDEEADPSSDVEFSLPVNVSPARSSRRLRMKAETLGGHDFTKGVKRIKGLKPPKPQQDENSGGLDSNSETPVSSKSAAAKKPQTAKTRSKGDEKQKANNLASGDADKSNENKLNKTMDKSDTSAPAVEVTAVKKRGRGRPRKNETVVAPPPPITIKEEPEDDFVTVDNVENVATAEADKANEDAANESDVNIEEEANADAMKSDASNKQIRRLFSCQICSKTFDRKASLKEHLFIHSRESDFKCDDCEKSFSRWYKLKMHKILKHGASNDKGNLPERKRRAPRTYGISKKHADKRDGSFVCDVCNKRFNSKLRLHEHKFLHKEDARYYCHICSRRFSSFSKLERHLKVMHDQFVDEDFYKRLTDEILPPEGTSVVIKNQGEVLIIKCNLCEEFEGSREDAVEHLKIHADFYANVCEYCDKSFLYVPALKTHQSYLHRSEFRQQCPVCDEKFARIEDLALHAKKSHEVKMEIPAQQRNTRRFVNKKPFPCPHCEQTFQKKNRLNDHIWVKHDKKEKPFKCPLCDKRFIREDIMKDHMFVHDRKSRYVCETCGKVFQKKFELSQHRHLDDPWRCSICDKVFTTYNGYKLHTRKHTEVPSHMCRFCGAMFFFKGRLENHERSHTGEKPFLCKTCNARFSDRYVYNKHVRGHNVPDDAKHVCPTCNRKFVYPAQLRTHMQVHLTPRAKHICPVCEKTYLKKESLRQHMKVHEPQEEAQLYYQCQVCELLYANEADCEKCRNNHIRTANAVAEGNITEDGNVAVEGLVENTVVTQIDDNTQVLVVSLEDLEHLGHQFVIEQGDGGSQETVQHLILNADGNQTIQIAPNQKIKVMNADELSEQSGQVLIDDGEVLLESESAQELVTQSGQVIIEQSDQEQVEQSEEVVEHSNQEMEVQSGQELNVSSGQEVREHIIQVLLEQPGQELITQDELMEQDAESIKEENIEETIVVQQQTN